MSKVVRLGGGEIPESKVEPSVVSYLERVIERAKAGEISSIALIAVAPNGGVVSDWECPESAIAFRLIAACDFLKRDLMRAVDEVSGHAEG